MFVRFKDHLRHHAIAYVALFIVLGGTAVALPGKGTVTSNDIAKKAVKSKNIAKKAVKSKNLADEAVTTAKIADQAVTGAKADEESFKGLIQGDGEQFMTSATVDAGGFLPDPIVLAEVPTMGVIQFIACFPDSVAGADIRTQLVSFDDSQPFFGSGTVIGSDEPPAANQATTTEQASGIFQGGGGTPLIAQGPTPNQDNLGTSGWWDWHLSRGTGEDTVGAHVSVSGFNSSQSADPNGECTVTATVEYQD